MPLTLTEKKAVVAEVSTQAQSALSAIVADYRGLTVTQMTILRAKARNSGVYLRVVPNNLTKRAFAETDFACLEDRLVGPLFLALSLDAPGAAARLLRDFGKDHDALEVKAIALSGRVLEPSELKAVADLPTKDEAIATLMAVFKAPVEKLARTINEVPSKFVRTVAAVRDQKQAG